MEFIKSHEGLRLKRYGDAVGVATIGYGHTGSGVRKGRITIYEAHELLSKDIKTAEKAVKKYTKVRLTQGQFDALVSFVFNLGASAFKRSTLLKKLNKKDYIGASAEFTRWVWAKGIRLPGLVRRRREESVMFSRKIK